MNLPSFHRISLVAASLGVVVPLVYFFLDRLHVDLFVEALPVLYPTCILLLATANATAATKGIMICLSVLANALVYVLVAALLWTIVRLVFHRKAPPDITHNA